MGTLPLAATLVALAAAPLFADPATGGPPGAAMAAEPVAARPGAPASEAAPEPTGPRSGERGPAADPARLVRYPHAHGERLVFTYLGDLWTSGADGSAPRRLTVSPARDAFPRFSPDGRWIAFSSDRAGNADVWLLPAEGGTPVQLTFHSAGDDVLGWTPDSRRVLFASNRSGEFTGRLYTVSVEGGMPVDAGVDMGFHGSFSPDGSMLAYNRKGQAYWRQGYRGSNQSDVTVMDVSSRAFRQLTDFDGKDRWPSWGADGAVYFVSDRSGADNVWSVPAAGGEARQVTRFTDGVVRWPAMSADGATLVFEREFGIWRLDVASGRAEPVPVEIAAETQSPLSERVVFDSEADDFDLAPSGERIVFSVHGEVFTAPVEEGDLVRLTAGAARERGPAYSPDGAWVAWVSDASGREEVWVGRADGTGEPRRASDVDALKDDLAWAPDSERLAYTASDGALRVWELESGASRVLASGEWGGVSAPVWSPDGRWLAFDVPGHARTRDVQLVPASGGEARPVTFSGYDERDPAFSPDGKTLYYIRSTGLEAAIAGPPSADVWAVRLERLDADPDDPATKARADSAADGADAVRGGAGGPEAGRRGGRPPASTPPVPVVVDWGGLERRTRQVTRMPFPVPSFAVAPDGRRIAFVTREPSGARTVPVLYTVGEDGEDLTRVAALGGGGDDDGPGFGGGPSGLRWAPDGRRIFLHMSDAVHHVAVAGGGGNGPGGGAAGGGERGGALRQVRFRAPVEIDRPAQWTQMLDDAWRMLRHRFYDPEMHGVDWAAMRERYRPLAALAGSTVELVNVVNEMIGELNASHSGSRAAPERGGPGVTTPFLGVELDPDEAAGRYRVSYVYDEGPAGKDWVGVSVGDWLMALDGREVRAGDNYHRLLNERLNRRVEVAFAKSASGDGRWTARIDPASPGEYRDLRYERWVDDRRELVDSLSGGRIAYVHIRGMNQPSLQRFQMEIRRYRDREALVIDQRYNGGGNIEQQLLAVLAVPEYQILVPRGSRESFRPAGGFFGPKVVLQNWRSGSNAEMFPAGFRSLGLGRVIGTPTAGGVIGTGSYRLVDGSTVRVPGSGVYLVDGRRTNMENYGVPPDIVVENTPEEHLAGRDRVIEVAVAELLRELSPGEIRAGSR